MRDGGEVGICYSNPPPHGAEFTFLSSFYFLYGLLMYKQEKY